MAWLDPSALRSFVKNLNTDDEETINLAVDVACGKVEELCGPIANTTITGEVHTLRGINSICLHFPATSLVSIAPEGGTALTVSDWAIDGQVLTSKVGTALWGRYVVSYVAGYFDATDAAAKAPAWARSAALHIGQQHMRTLRRFGQTTDGPTGFLVPAVAMEEMAGHLLAPGGFA